MNSTKQLKRIRMKYYEFNSLISTFKYTLLKSRLPPQ